jgi:hypothetical protein
MSDCTLPADAPTQNENGYDCCLDEDVFEVALQDEDSGDWRGVVKMKSDLTGSPLRTSTPNP